MVEPEAIPDRDYTTQQTADLCGISINTLLSWERRYGMPNPQRNDRGERVYRRPDLELIRRLRVETANGTPVAEVVRLLRERDEPVATPGGVVDDVVVALDITPTKDSFARPLPPTTLRESSTHLELLAACERYDRSSISTILSRLALESDPAIVAEAVVIPVLNSLAQKVAMGSADPITLQVAARWFAARLSHWLDVVNPDSREAREIVVLDAGDHDINEIGTLALALRLARQGLHVLDLPPNSPLESIVAVAKASGATRIDLVTTNDGPTRAIGARARILRDLLPASVTITVAIPGEVPTPTQESPHSVSSDTSASPD